MQDIAQGGKFYLELAIAGDVGSVVTDGAAGNNLGRVHCHATYGNGIRCFMLKLTQIWDSKLRTDSSWAFPGSVTLFTAVVAHRLRRKRACSTSTKHAAITILAC